MKFAPCVTHISRHMEPRSRSRKEKKNSGCLGAVSFVLYMGDVKWAEEDEGLCQSEARK